jgi:hypothetical protein
MRPAVTMEGYTAEMLYYLLDDLDVNTTSLRKKNATFRELEKIYYAHLTEKIHESYGRHLKRPGAFFQ